MIIPFVVMVLLVSACMVRGCNAQTRTDYKDHFVIGAAVGFTGAWTQLTLNNKEVLTKQDKNKMFINGVIWSSLIGITKEVVLDPAYGGTTEWQDAALTIAGGVVGAGALRLFAGVGKKQPVIFAKGNYKGMVVKM